MEIITNIINLVKDHWVEVLALIGAIDVALGIIVKWTPVTWDNNVYSIVHSWIEKLGKK